MVCIHLKIIILKKWATNFQELTYPAKIVEYKFARKRYLKIVKENI